MKKEILLTAVAIIILGVAYVSFFGQSSKTGAYSYAANELGRSVNTTSTSVTTRVLVLAANADRKFALIQNGAVATNLYFDTASTTQAVYLAANANYTISLDNLYIGNIYASSTAGASVVNISYK